jgi:ketosteroid isomerase-like protein
MAFKNPFIAIAAVLLLSLTAANAQPVSDDAAVWSVIEQSWQAERQGDVKWIENLLSADFVGWSNDAPAPRDKASTRRWNTFSSKQVQILEYELYPLSIVVHGDMAVAHYLFSTASRPKGEAVSTRSGRFTDILIRVDGQWKYISWHGGEDP